MRRLFFHLPLCTVCICLFCSSAAWASIGCAVEPSFDCSKADHDAEELICRDNELAALDNLLAGAYQTALHNFPDAEMKTLKATQRGWIKGRNDCWKTEDLYRCIKHAYETRITELQIQGGLITVPEPVKYKCNSGDYDYLTAIFYTQTTMPAVVLTGNTDKDFWQKIAFLVPAGSGAKYQGNDVLFWTKGAEALIERRGKMTNCVELHYRVL
jgi:uncharacterized protein